MSRLFPAAALCAVLLLGAAGSRAETSLDTVRARTRDLSGALDEERLQISADSAELGVLSGKIRTLKHRRQKDPTLVDEYRLHSLLQKAQALSDRLDRRIAAQHRLEEDLKAAQKTLTDLLDEEIEAKRNVANARTESLDERRKAARELDLLSAERMKLPLDGAEAPLPTSVSGLWAGSLSREEAQERVAAVGDFERRLLREVETLKLEISELRRRRFLRSEVAHLMDEESFFGEQGFVRGPGNKKESDPSLLGKGAVSTPVPLAPVTRVDPPSSDSPKESAARADARDPLAQLALEFGVTSKEEAEEWTGRRRADETIDQMKWLEFRLATTVKLLDRVREKLRALQQLRTLP